MIDLRLSHRQQERCAARCNPGQIVRMRHTPVKRTNFSCRVDAKHFVSHPSANRLTRFIDHKTHRGQLLDCHRRRSMTVCAFPSRSCPGSARAIG